MQKKKVERNSVLIGFSSSSDTANANKVSNLLATADARWWSMAGQAVKCGNYAATRFAIILIYDIMDPRRVEEDRYAAYAFNGMQPLLFDGTRRTVSLSAWLCDMEKIFHICHIEAHLQVSLASRCLVADARLWWMTLG
ncbi:hypothetical protein TIFTF001_035464, partial [Ficus carica]